MRFIPAVSLVQIQLQPPFGPVVKRPKTPPFHGGNTSSNLVRVTKKKFALYVRTSFFIIQRFEQDGFAFRQNSDLPADGPKGRVRVGARECTERISSGSPKKGSLHFMCELLFFIIQRFEQDGFAFRQNSDLPADGPKGRVRVGARQCAERISSGSPKIGKSRWRFADFYFFTFNFSLFTSIYNRFLEGNM